MNITSTHMHLHFSILWFRGDLSSRLVRLCGADKVRMGCRPGPPKMPPHSGELVSRVGGVNLLLQLHQKPKNSVTALKSHITQIHCLISLMTLMFKND